MRIAFILAAAILLYGTYYEAVAALIGCVLLVLLLHRTATEKKLVLPKSLFLWAVILLPVFALISVPFSIDKGMAGLGFVKMLPAALFCLVISFEEKETKEKCLQSVPLVAVVITAVGLLSKFTPYREMFYIQDRFSGNFQYANSYALFLLVSVVILLYSKKNPWIRAALSLFLLYGIWETGSRSIGLLALAAFAVWCMSLTGRKKYFVLAVPAGVFALAATGVFMGSRWGDFNLLSSSFVSRLFYNYDGIKMVLSHPLGLGYKGFLFYQGAVQTANYSSTYAHNELLQAALDFGWIPAILLLAGACIALFKKGISARNRCLIAVIFIHSLFDWDMQFTALLMILILVIEMDTDKKEVSVTGAGKAAAAAAGSFAIAACLWLGMAAYFEYIGNYETAAKVYPGLTTSQMQMINSAADSERFELAKSICSRNDYCVIALQAMAEKSFKEGNIKEMEGYAMKAVRAGKYSAEAYEFYIMAMNGAFRALLDNGDREGAYAVLQYINKIPDLINQTEEQTSPYAKYLYNKTEIRLDKQYTNYLQDVHSLIENDIPVGNN